MEADSEEIGSGVHGILFYDADVLIKGATSFVVDWRVALATSAQINIDRAKNAVEQELRPSPFDHSPERALAMMPARQELSALRQTIIGQVTHNGS